MDALFFLATREDAIKVRSSENLPDEAVGDALCITDPSPLAGLAAMLGACGPAGPLRDATCQSFPVWDLGRETTERLAQLDEAEIDVVAEGWLARHEPNLDADLHELTTCLLGLREGIRDAEDGVSLYALLEERAW